jgi:hypothetical protein
MAKSTDNGQHWKKIATISEPGRDLDNAQLIEARNGDWLLSCRSVRWQESYILRIYRSTDKGTSWEKSGVIDSTAGSPGSLGKPDKGIYEPHLYYLDNGNLSVMYANERHVTEHPSYNQQHLGPGAMGHRRTRWRNGQTRHARMDKNEEWQIYRRIRNMRPRQMPGSL